MGWEFFAQLILQEGVPLAQSLFTKIASGNPPTTQDFAELRQLSEQNEGDIMKARLTAAGIALDSDQAKALLALTQ